MGENIKIELDEPVHLTPAVSELTVIHIVLAPDLSTLTAVASGAGLGPHNNLQGEPVKIDEALVPGLMALVKDSLEKRVKK